MRSLSVVPVGITRFRDHLPHLETFDRESSAEVIDQIEGWQKRFREDGVNPEIPNFVQASDEWYLSAGREVPEEDRYDGYLQLENGVGMVRLLKNEVHSALKGFLDHESSLYKSLSLPEKDYLAELPERGRHVTTICGKLIEPVIRELAGQVTEAFPGLSIRVFSVRNDFFGHTITVSGLITGQDLIGQLKELVGNEDPGKVLGEEILLPVNMLRAGEKVFLDDLTTEDVENAFYLPVGVIWSGGEELVRSVLGLSHREEGNRQIYESWEPDDQ
jgi:NifB/MoaA-like Fe-S oxidoreductase